MNDLKQNAVSVILLAGGSGTRMNKQTPKQFLPLAGRPMIMHILERFERIAEIDEVVVVCLPQYKELLQGQIASYALKKKYVLIDGGETRQESAYYGLKAASNTHVIIHEAARPFVMAEEFERLILENSEAVTYGIPIPFTVSIMGDGFVTGLLERDKLINIQLPQKFQRTALLSAHEKARQGGMNFTEDASLFFHYTGIHVKVLQGTNYNVKITDSVDLLSGELIYKEYIIGRDSLE